MMMVFGSGCSTTIQPPPVWASLVLEGVTWAWRERRTIWYAGPAGGAGAPGAGGGGGGTSPARNKEERVLIRHPTPRRGSGWRDVRFRRFFSSTNLSPCFVSIPLTRIPNQRRKSG